ncbi:MAG TPA: uroporphyrinogen-III synthase [Acidimicrobiales bacterium]|nr:uroporphyrinogen-III synthase [Acidimicrobiales bacterium]
MAAAGARSGVGRSRRGGLIRPVTVGITADRRWEEQARLLRDREVQVVHGATLRTIDLSAEAGLRETTAALADQAPDYLVVTTGMGMRRWMEAAARWQLDGALLASLARARVVARGAKAHSATRAAGLDVWWRAPQETMQEIIDRLATTDDIGASRVALQLFDPGHNPSTEALRAMAGELVELPVYQWALPFDPGPAEALVRAAVAGEVQAITFTAQPAVHNLFRIAGRLGLEDKLRDALNGPVVTACVGPVCASAATDEGVRQPLWPDPPRLPALIRQLTERLNRD